MDNIAEERRLAGFKISEYIECPPQEVFEFVTDPANAPLWLPRVIRVDTDSAGHLARGTRYTETRLAKGRESSIDMEVQVVNPPNAYSTGFNSGGYNATYNYYFEAEASGTRVDMVFDIVGRGLMASIVSYAIKRQDKKQLERLKDAVEGPGDF